VTVNVAPEDLLVKSDLPVELGELLDVGLSRSRSSGAPRSSRPSSPD
jgi:hypothetical protein